MIKVRKSDKRGHVKYGWLDSRHTFSFGNYYDPEYVGFSKLRVINEDRLKGGSGFGSHPHRDMEIITYVIDGELKHEDNMGNSSVIMKNEIQKMTAGKGVIHSEFNNSDSDIVHLLQIWIIPSELGLEPNYNQLYVDKKNIDGNLFLIASGNGRDGDNLLQINQDVDLYLSSLNDGSSIRHKSSTERKIWIQIIKGSMTVLGENLGIGDGAAINNVNEIEIKADDSSEFLLFDMA